MKTRISISAILLIFCLSSGSVFTQDEQPQSCRSAIFVEGLGQGILYSINYDYRITPHICLRIGFTTWSISTYSSMSGFYTNKKGVLSFTGFPIMINYLSGEGDSHLEVGFGFIPGNASYSGSFLLSAVSGRGIALIGTATLGYRLQPQDGGAIFRIGVTPLFTGEGILPWGGLSVGVAF